MSKSKDFILRLDTTKTKRELKKSLKKHEPWSIRIDFNNGVSTLDVKHRTPFAENPTQKASISFENLPMDDLKGGRMLDIGCNSGYNSIFAAREHKMKPTGIDVRDRHIEVSTMLANMADIKADFKIGSAETYLEENSFDLVLHFGTLYHLPNPLLSLETTYKNLKPKGWVALETQVYEGADKNESYFMHMHNNDNTNFWALSPHVMKTYMELLGFINYKVILKVTPAILERDMHRMIIVAQKG